MNSNQYPNGSNNRPQNGPNQQQQQQQQQQYQQQNYQGYNNYPPPPPNYQQQQYNNYQYPPPPPYPLAPLPKTNTKSIVALILGILAIMVPYIGFFIGIAAIIYASLSLKEIKRVNEQGKGLAVAGLVTGIIGTAIYGIILLVVVIVVIASFSEPSVYY